MECANIPLEYSYELIKSYLGKRSFCIAYNPEKRNSLLTYRLGKISSHCINTLLQLSNLFSGVTYSSNVLRSFVECKTFIITVYGADKEEKEFIVVKYIFHDLARLLNAGSVDEAERDLDKSARRQFYEKVRKIGGLFRDKILNEAKELSESSIDEASPALLSAFENKIFKTINCLQVQSLLQLRDNILWRGQRLNDETGYMYYFLFRFPRKLHETSFRCHAFTLQQVRSEGVETYNLLQSWLDKFTLFDSRARQILFPMDVLDLFKDLITIFKKNVWDADCHVRWKKWFISSAIKEGDCHSNFILEFLQRSDGEVFYPAGLSLSCSSAKFNTKDLDKTIEENYEMMCSYATKEQS